MDPAIPSPPRRERRRIVPTVLRLLRPPTVGQAHVGDRGRRRSTWPSSWPATDSSCSPAWNATDPVSSDSQVASVIDEVRGTTAKRCHRLGRCGYTVPGPGVAEGGFGRGADTPAGRSGPFHLHHDAVNHDGSNYFGKLLLTEAKSLGFTPDDYTIMPFDGGFSGGSSQVTALQDFNAQLVSTFGWSSSEAYAHEGFSGMNGRTDSAEYFYQSDFQTMLSFAESNEMSRYTFWSVNRDRECNPPSNNGNLSSECSSVAQNSWDFTAYTVAFAKNTSVTPPTTPPGGGGGGGAEAAVAAVAVAVAAVPPRPGPRVPPTAAATSCPTTAASGPPTSGTTTRCRAARPGRGTTTAPAEPAYRPGPRGRPAAREVRAGAIRRGGSGPGRRDPAERISRAVRRTVSARVEPGTTAGRWGPAWPGAPNWTTDRESSPWG